LVITLGWPKSGIDKRLLANTRTLTSLLALLSACLSFFLPATAWSDIYKWTDEQGNLVISNASPANPKQVTGMELLAKETKPVNQSPVPVSRSVVTPTEQMLLEKVDRLERQLQAQRDPPQEQRAAPVIYNASNYQMQPPPPPSYYPSDYPSYYYPYVAPYSYVVFPVRTFSSRSSFSSSHNGSFRNGSFRHGRR
jgi:hypothetical protein